MKVSVVIPCYNVDKYIEECVYSVLNQTYPDIEIICIDDGSSDNTVKILNEIKESAGKEILIIETPNRGASSARNTGLRNSKGEYVQFLDADDILLPDKIKHQVDLILANDYPPSLIVGDYIRRYPNGLERIVRSDRRSSWHGLIGIRLGITSSNLWNTSVLKQIDGWEETRISSQEYELMFRLLKNDPKVIYDDQLHTVLRHRESGSISRTNVRDNRMIAIRLRQHIYAYLSENGQLTLDLEKHHYQLLFTEIRALFKYDRREAIKQYNLLFPRGFLPESNELYKKSYIILFKYFGFNRTQQLWNWYIDFKNYVGRLKRYKLTYK
jgi:glycosyltransferase involved in cell wall biosynthesis